MARRGTVLEFRRPRRPKWFASLSILTDKVQPFRRSKVWLHTAIAVGAVVIGVMFYLLAGPRWVHAAVASAAATTVSQRPLEVLWVDGDSGTIDGRPFRLHGIDAPEGSPSRAQCNNERLRAEEARSEVRALTASGTVEIRKSHGTDKYDRDLLSLSVDGQDIASLLIASGHIKRWNFESGDAKPRWCGT